MAPEEILEAHPHLTLAQVYAALAYYHDFVAEIRAEWDAADRLIAEIRAEYPGRPRPLS
jgi:hypothetical protein